MNKKFLSAVLFGALIAGSSVTFTGCIDNDEPAGISDLRSAKAALIRANEAYKLVEVEIRKVDIERQQVLLEREKLDMELQKLNVQIKQAQTDYEVTYYQNKKDSIVEAFKGHLFTLQETAAQNETAYLKALAELEAAKIYATDSVFANKLSAITKDLGDARTDIETAMGDVVNLTNRVLKFSSDSIAVAKEFIAADIKSGESKLANDSVTLAEFKKLAEDYSDDAVNAQILDIDKQIIAIDKKVAELKQSIITTDGTVAPIEQAISKQKVTLEAKNQSIALDVPAAIESEFISYFISGSGSTDMNNLAGANWTSGQSSNIATKQINGSNNRYSFKQAPVIKELQLGTVSSTNTIDEKTVLSAKINNFSDAVNVHGIELYRDAYNLLKNVTAYNLPAISVNGDITADDKAKVAAALEKVNADLTTAETTYKADTTALKTAYAAYKTAATAYGITQQLSSTIEATLNTKWDAYTGKRSDYENAMTTQGVSGKKTTYDNAVKAYNDAKKVVDDKVKNDPTYTATDAEKLAIYNADVAMTAAKKDYEDALAKVPSTDLTAAITALKAEMTAYYPKRKALVGEEFKATIAGFNDDKEFVIADKLASMDAEQFATLIKKGKTAVVGGVWSSVTISSSSTDKDGAVQTWLKASKKLYGTDASSISAGLMNAKTTILPLEEVLANLSTATVTPTDASASTYVVLQNAKNAFSTIDTWTTYAESLSKLATEKAALEAPIIAEVAKQKAALDGIYEPLRDTIYEICKLDATQYSDAAVSKVATKLGITTKPNQNGEKQSLASLKQALQVAINGTLTIKYDKYTYDGTTLAKTQGNLNSTTGIATAIADIESNIVALKKYIADKNDAMTSFDNNSVEIAGKTKAEYEAALVNAQEELKGYQAAFDALSKAKDALIAAMTAE